MKEVNHINIPDSNNNIYCRTKGKVVEFDTYLFETTCLECPFFRGTAQGEGVECSWKDVRDIPSVYIVKNPNAECNHVVTAEAKAKKKGGEK